jgi:hypothetical protein
MGLLLSTSLVLRAQHVTVQTERGYRTISVVDLIHDMDKDLSNLLEKFARTFHHQGQGRLGNNEAAAFIAMSAFAGEMHGLHTVVENAQQAQIVTMLRMMDDTLRQADRAVRRAHAFENISAEWHRNVARFQAVRQAYGLHETQTGRTRFQYRRN